MGQGSDQGLPLLAPILLQNFEDLICININKYIYRYIHAYSTCYPSVTEWGAVPQGFCLKSSTPHVLWVFSIAATRICSRDPETLKHIRKNTLKKK